MSEFDDNLWQEIVREHGQDLADASGAAAKRSRPARPRLLAGTSLGLAGVGVVLALVLSAASSSPAFAVTRNPDGTVSVKVFRVAGIAAANAKLAALGIRARIVPQTAGCAASTVVARGTNATSGPAESVPFTTVAQGTNATSGFDPHGIPAGRTLVIAARRAGSGFDVKVVNAVRGAAPACVPPPITAAQRQSYLANAQCMREHGVPNLPNPTFPAAGGVAFDVRPGSLAHEGTAILQASKACNNVGTPLPLGGLAGPACSSHSGASGNSGNSGSGETGDSGTTTTGNSGNSGSLQPAQGKGCQAGRVTGGPPPGNSGNSGNSGTTGDSGNSGNSGNS
jgi:hypothetical protein